MRTLDAINIALTALGESLVTSDNSPNPSIGVIKNSLEDQRKSMLSTGWWFNAFESTLSPDREGFITAPKNSLTVYSFDSKMYIVRDKNLLYNLSDSTYFFSEPVPMKFIIDLEIEELPESAAQYVAYATAAEVYANDLGVDDNYKILEQKAARAYSEVLKHHLRNMKYSTVQGKRYTRIRSRMQR